MYYLKTSASFDGAHFLHGYDGKCKNIHGHHWTVEVRICGGELRKEGAKRGMLVDFSDFKRIVKELCDGFDHALIYEDGTLNGDTLSALRGEGFALIALPYRPTAENLARDFYNRLKKSGLPVYEVEVYESPDNCAAYRE